MSVRASPPLLVVHVALEYKQIVPDDYLDTIRSMSLVKALAIGAYGESVAAYRYRTLAEKNEPGELQDTLSEMATEEQGHHTAVQNLSRKCFPDSDFVLTPEDKELVIVGPRVLDVSGGPALKRAFDQIYESERLTGRFYAALHDVTTRDELKPLLRQMADECVEHAARLKAMPTG